MANRFSRAKLLQGNGAINIVAQGSFTHVAGTATAGAQVSYSSAVTGAVVGDWVTGVSSNSIGGSVTLYGSVQSAGTVTVTAQGPVGGTPTWSAGTIFYRLERP